MHPLATGALFVLQCFHVLFLALHDWIPLGTLNDVKAVRAANPGRKLERSSASLPLRSGWVPAPLTLAGPIQRGCSGGSGSATASYSSAN
jgi:hypothetical protein